MYHLDKPDIGAKPPIWHHNNLKITNQYRRQYLSEGSVIEELRTSIEWCWGGDYSICKTFSKSRSDCFEWTLTLPWILFPWVAVEFIPQEKDINKTHLNILQFTSYISHVVLPYTAWFSRLSSPLSHACSLCACHRTTRHDHESDHNADKIRRQKYEVAMLMA